MFKGFKSISFTLLMLGIIPFVLADINQCNNTLDTPGIYILNESVNSTGTCFNIAIENVTLDCNGYTIIYSLNGENSTYGIYTNQFNTTIKNCRIQDGNLSSNNNNRYGIYFNTNDNSTITNNFVNTSNATAIYLYDGANYNILTNNTATSAANYGIYLTQSNNNTLTNNTGVSNSSYGIIIYQSSSNTLNNNVGSSNSNRGIFIWSSSNNTLTNNTGTSVTKRAFYLSQSSSNILTNNNGISDTNNGIVLDALSNNNVLTNNTGTSNSSQGIFLHTISNNTLTGNVGISNSSQAIYMFNLTNNILTNNTGTSNTNAGIYLSSSSNNSLTSNNGTSNIGYGISVESSSSNNILISNMATSNSSAALYVSNATDNTFTNNTGTSNTYIGIYLYASSNHNTLINNTGISNISQGIQIQTSANNILTGNNGTSINNSGIRIDISSNNTLTSNIGTSNASTGIYLSGSSNNTLTNNNGTSKGTAWGNSGIRIESSNYNNLTNNIGDAINNFGIFLFSNANHNTLTNNTGTSNTSSGIYLNLATNNTLSSNTGTSNTNAGIYLQTSSSNTLTNNTGISKSENGIDLDNSSNNILVSNDGSSNNKSGISISTSSNNNILNNNIGATNGTEWDNDGILVYSSINNTLNSNKGTSYSGRGIEFYHGFNNTLLYSNGTSNISIGIQFINNTNSIISNSIGITYTQDNISAGILITSNSTNIIINNSIGVSSTGRGIQIGGYSYNNTIINSIGNGTGSGDGNSQGIYLSDSSYNRIINSTAQGDGDPGLRMDNSIFNNISNTRTISNSDNSLEFQNSSYNTITNVTATSNTSYGMRFSPFWNASKGASVNNIIINSTIQSQSYNVLELDINSTNNTFVGNKLISGDGAHTLIYLVATASNNMFYWNNFTNTSSYYVNDLNGTNIYNTTINGIAEGNLWFNVLNGSINITGNVNSNYGGGLYVGSLGSKYPYNGTNSGGKVTSNVIDYAPLTPNYEEIPPLDCGTLNTSGIYTLTTNVTSNGTCFTINADNVTLDCQGNWITYSIGGESNTHAIFTQKFNTTIKNCNIVDGNWTNNNTYRPAISIDTSDNSTIINNFINVSNTQAILLNNGANFNNLTNNTGISDSSYGISLDSSSNNILTSNTGTSNSSYGIQISSSSYNTIINCTGNGTSTGNGNNNGIRIESSNYNNIINSIAQGNIDYGLRLDSSQFNNITNTIAISNADSGVSVQNSSYNIFINVTSVSNNSATGMTFQPYWSGNGSSHNNIIINSTIQIYNCTWVVIWLRTNSTNNTFIGNKLISGGSASNLLYLENTSSNNIFYWNNFTNTTGYYVQDLNGSNNYNYTINGKNEGNIWYNVMNGTINISGNTSSNYGGVLYIGNNGTGYPYNSTTSLSKVSGNVVDYAPLTLNYEETPTQQCGTLSTPGIYTLTSNITSNGTCFTITADNVTLDCNGYTITYSLNGADSTFGVYTNKFNTTIKNCNIQDGNWTSNITTRIGIYFNGVNNSLLYNNTVNVSSSWGIGLVTSSNNTLLFNTVISNSSGLVIDWYSDYNLLMYNNATSNSDVGISLITSSYNNLTSNAGTNFDDNYGIRLLDSSNNNYLMNNTGTNSAQGGGVAIISSNNNILFSNKWFGNSGTIITFSSNNTIISDNSTGVIGIDIISSNYSTIMDCTYLSGSWKNVLIDSSVSSIENAFINCSYDISKESVNGTNNYMTRQWYFEANITNSSGSPVANANVTVYNSTGAIIYSGLTNSTGNIERTTITEYTNTGGNRTYETPHNITITKSGYYTNSTSYNITSTQNIKANMLLGKIADIISPYFTTIPASATIEYDTDWTGVDFNAADDIALDTYSVNDSSFTINTSGYLNNIPTLSIGIYTLNITINDTAGNTNSTIYTLTVTTVPVVHTPSSSGGGSSDTSGSSLGSNINTTTIENATEIMSFSQYWPNIINGNRTVNINQTGMPIIQIVLTTNNNTNIANMLKITAQSKNPYKENISALIYTYILVDTNIEQKYIDNLSFKFKVNKMWLTQNNLTTNNITIYVHDNNWSGVSVSKYAEDTGYIYYSTQNAKLSNIAIGGPIIRVATSTRANITTPETLTNPTTTETIETNITQKGFLKRVWSSIVETPSKLYNNIINTQLSKESQSLIIVAISSILALILGVVTGVLVYKNAIKPKKIRRMYNKHIISERIMPYTEEPPIVQTPVTPIPIQVKTDKMPAEIPTSQDPEYYVRKVNELLLQCEYALDNGRIEEAKNYYGEARTIYFNSEMDYEHKSRVYNKIILLYSRLHK